MASPSSPPSRFSSGKTRSPNDSSHGYIMSGNCGSRSSSWTCRGSGKVNDASMSRVGERTKNKAEGGCCRGRASKTSNFKKMTEADNASESGCRMSSWEMLYYGHKRWDDDHWEWKEFYYEKTFTECCRSEGKTQAASDTKYGNKACDSTSSIDADDPSVIGYRMSTAEMHKPWDDDCWEWKEVYEKAFAKRNPTKGILDDAPDKGYATKTSNSECESDADDASKTGYRMSTRKMLSYGHKPWDIDHWEWKETYEKAFTERNRTKGKAREVPDGGYDNKACDCSSESDEDDASGRSSRMSTGETLSYGHMLWDNEREMLSYGYEPWDNDHWSRYCDTTSDSAWESDADD